jgi:AGCS family alanine or glycine:cation symporter
MRGLLSNEAGCGTSPTAHAAASTDSPAAQGVWGIFEVLVDTVLLCTLTALVILVSYGEVEMLGEDGVRMAIRAYSTVLGGVSDVFFSFAVFCFGYATLLCWGGYGLESLRFLSKKRSLRVLYLLAFAACIAIGAHASPDAVWDVADFSVAVLTGINLLALFCMRREIRKQTVGYFCGE